MIDKDGKVYRGLQAQVAYLTEKVENGGGGSTPTGPTVDKITSLDLAIGDAALTYDANDGANLTKQGQIKAGGNTYTVAVEDELPIVPGDNITIDATEDGKHLKISATGGGGSGVAGVSSFGGATGAINVGTNLSMNGNVVNADFKPTPVVIETTSDADASSGTLTANQLATLQANTANPLVKRNEYYYLNDNLHTAGALGYTHIGYENSTWYVKNITITISTKGWVRTVDTIPDPINIDGKTGYIALGANLHMSTSNVLSATNTVTTVNGIAGPVTLAEGNNVTISKSGNTFTIAAAGGSGTSTGFDNVRKIEYVDSSTQYNADSEEYLNTSGTSTVYYKDGTNTTVPYVQTLGLMPGNNITFTEELVGDAWKVKVNATGGTDCTDIAVVDLGDQSTFESTSTLSDEQADLLESKEYSVLKFTDPTGWNNALPLDVCCPFISEDTTHNSRTYRIEADNGYVYNVSVTLQRTSGNVWGQKTYDITKTAAASGGKLYQHNINACAGSSTIVYCTLYTTDNTQINSLTPWLMKFGTDRVIDAGYVFNTNKYYPLLFMKADSESIKGWYLDPETQKPVATEAFGTGGAFTDTVKEV